MRMCTALLAGLCLAARVAAAQEPTPVLPGDRDASAELAKIIAATRAHHLPVDPILEKVQYAIVMRAPAARIVAAARAIAARLEIARDALAPRDYPADVAAGEGALSYNVPKVVLTTIRNASPEPSVVVPLGALTQLVASGVSVTRASDIVTSLIRRGASGQQLASFSNDVNSDVRLGGRPDDALNVRMRGLTAALAPAGQAAVTQAITTGAAAPPKKP
ncbi:MAG: hypothetical protein JWM41_4573 [Gemmatimonadetes bacterium]|nr:hypothetical protein [Gemmatimonadota bacterium]